MAVESALYHNSLFTGVLHRTHTDCHNTQKIPGSGQKNDSREDIGPTFRHYN